MPKYQRVRPDFQAPGPRLLIDNTIELQDDKTRVDFENDDVNADVDEYDPPRLQYYESKKVLGRLYRAIDEQDFLKQLQSQTGTSPHAPSRSIAESVWGYVKGKTELIQWEHWYQFALDTRERYMDPSYTLASSSLPFLPITTF